MRTPQQLANIRNTLLRMPGPYSLVGFLASDEAINEWADNLQRKFDETTVGKWTLKIRLEEQASLPWEQINPEPKVVEAPLSEVKKQCIRLFRKYHQIIAIQIISEDGSTQEIIR